MTDAQLLIRLLQNDERGWRHICRNVKPGFMSILGKMPSFCILSKEDLDDVFQEALIVLMQKVKSGEVTVSRDGAIFSCVVQIGKLIACNHVRKKRPMANDDLVTISDGLHKDDEVDEISVDEKQQTQNEFLDRVFDSIPDDCKTLLKQFYWGHKSMDEIASILGMLTQILPRLKRTSV